MQTQTGGQSYRVRLQGLLRPVRSENANADGSENGAQEYGDETLVVSHPPASALCPVTPCVVVVDHINGH